METWKTTPKSALSAAYRLSTANPLWKTPWTTAGIVHTGTDSMWATLLSTFPHDLTTTTISFQKSKGALFILVPVDNLTSHSYLRREPIYRGLTSPISIHSGIPIKNRGYSRRGICTFPTDRGSSTTPPFRKRPPRTSGAHLRSTCHTSFPSVRIHTAPLRAVLWTPIPCLLHRDKTFALGRSYCSP